MTGLAMWPPGIWRIFWASIRKAPGYRRPNYCWANAIFCGANMTRPLDLFEDLSQQTEKKDEILFWRGETYLKENRFHRGPAVTIIAVINDFLNPPMCRRPTIL